MRAIPPPISACRTNSTSPTVIILGHEQLIIQVSVREQFASSDKVITANITLLDTQELLFEPQFYKDKAMCQAELQAVLNRIEGELAHNPIPIILTLPDPPLPLYNAAKTVEQIVNGISAVAAKNPALANQIRTAVAAALQVSPELLGGTAGAGTG